MQLLLRSLFILFSAFCGYFVVHRVVGNFQVAYIGLASGLLIAVATITFQEHVKKTPLRIILGGAIGLTTGLIIANLVTYPLSSFIESEYFEAVVYLITNSLIGYQGLSIGMKKGDELKDMNMRFVKFWSRDPVNGASDDRGEDSSQVDVGSVLVDTSVIIDGRIVDICKTGFIDSKFMVPQFVLAELQNIADSTDSIRRARGKRGLEMLGKLKKESGVEVVIIEDDPKGIQAVDAKLVQVAKDKGASVLTNDWNLNKVAELQGVKVLNINALASAIKPVVLPGEMMALLVVKEGKEDGQGVGYLDDGTMVVVDNAKKQLGKNVNVEVTSVLQTTGGRMIFSKMVEGEQPPVLLHASN